MKYVLALLSAVFPPVVYPNIALLFSDLDYNPRPTHDDWLHTC
jgi:hypothetical protein